MGLSRQMACTLALAAAAATVVPGTAGYLSARMDTVVRAEQELTARLKAADEAALLRETRASAARTCATEGATEGG
jgi:hypothetical protein